MTLLIAIIASLFNIFAAKRLGFFEGLMLLCFFAGLFAVVIPLWVLAPKASSKEVWTEFGTYIGWQPIGLACVIGQISAGGSMIGIDGERLPTLGPTLHATNIFLTQLRCIWLKKFPMRLELFPV